MLWTEFLSLVLLVWQRLTWVMAWSGINNQSSECTNAFSCQVIQFPCFYCKLNSPHTLYIKRYMNSEILFKFPSTRLNFALVFYYSSADCRRDRWKERENSLQMNESKCQCFTCFHVSFATLFTPYTHIDIAGFHLASLLPISTLFLQHTPYSLKYSARLFWF